MKKDESLTRLSWAQFRFLIIGPLLAAPPEPGELAAKLAELAAMPYRHPTRDEPLSLSVKTIERWFYRAKRVTDPVAALARQVHGHAGTHPAVSAKVTATLETQYRAHPRWTMQLHHDNLVAQAKEDPSLGRVPSYTTLRRFMKQRAWLRHRKKPPGAKNSAAALVAREVRSFEVTHVHALWHLDFHEGSRRVLLPSGDWVTPQLLGVLDDRSRLCCHLQWYLSETAEALIHGLSQALQKRGLPRALMTDNGAAMIAAETHEGLLRLGILHHTTLPYSPEQNAKQEVFWAQVEGRLLAMLENETELTLALLNEATQAWSELEYQRKRHDELKASPLEIALGAPSVVRPCPPSEDLRRAFRMQVSRKVRRSDGTFTLAGVRFELPWHYRALTQVTLRVARWDLSQVDLIDPRSGKHLQVVRPLDKTQNADGRRRVVSVAPAADVATTPSGIAPLLRRLMADYAATGLPPAYLPTEGEIPRVEPDELPDLDIDPEGNAPETPDSDRDEEGNIP